MCISVLYYTHGSCSVLFRCGLVMIDFTHGVIQGHFFDTIMRLTQCQWSDSEEQWQK